MLPIDTVKTWKSKSTNLLKVCHTSQGDEEPSYGLFIMGKTGIEVLVWSYFQ